MIIIIVLKGDVRMKEKHSERREKIYEYLSATKAHPEAEEIYLALKKEFPSLSLATVYRNLSKFVEEGKAVEISGGNHVIHFDACVAPHYHFSCEQCNRIYDVEMPAMELTAEGLEKVGQVNRHELVFYGICNQCQE